jgi:predicted transcriptional regulator/transcriptional regulator with XRE-family HTH domain
MQQVENLQVGGRVRRLRRQRHIPQAELAARLGISASYLNLIEHNRRRITVDLLFRIAGYFGIEPGELAETDDGRLVGDLMELFGDDLFADADVTNQDIREFALSSPAVARAVMRLFDRYRQLTDARVVRAPAAAAEEGAGQGGHGVDDAVSDFLQARSNHFPEIEAAAERVRRDIDLNADSFEVGLRGWLQNVAGMDWRLASLPHGIAWRRSADGRVLEISDVLPPESALFAVARRAAPLAAEAEIEAAIAAAGLPEGDAPALAREVLSAYFAAALMMPYAAFLKSCQDTRYDIDRIARRFGASFEQVCHRMTTLQRPGAQGLPLHLVRTDIAGNISKRFSLSGIHIPRHAGACPRWNVYSAFLQPGRTVTQISQMPDGQTYFCIARSFERGGYRHNAPRRYFSIGLGCHVARAGEMVYSDGIDLGNANQIVPIGINCRICPRLECGQRAQPPAEHRFTPDQRQRGETLYGRIG